MKDKISKLPLKVELETKPVMRALVEASRLLSELKGEAKEKWGELTDDDLDVIEGNRDQLVGLIQNRYGKAKEEAEKEVEEWRKNL